MHSAMAGFKLEKDGNTMVAFCSPYTINLTGGTLPTHWVELLDKGLTFVPTTEMVATEDIRSDYKRLIRRLMLTDYFLGRPSPDDAIPFHKLFKKPSEWKPPYQHITEETKKTIRQISEATKNLLNTQKFNRDGKEYIRIFNTVPNLSTLEQEAIREIKKNKQLIIQPADKGGAVVALQKSLYIGEGLRQLNDETYYRKLDYPVFPSNVLRINKLLHSILRKGKITQKQYEFLKADLTDKQRYFYLLPKVHKPRDKWPNPMMPQGRPIVADCGSESYRVSQYIDYYLKPLSTRHQSYLKDTYDFISKIRDFRIQPNWFIVTADVTALYTNMDIDLILETVKQAFLEFPDSTRPDEELLDLLEITLRNNDFEFAGNMYLQLVGTAMGKTYAPSLADLYMDRNFDRKARTGFRIQPVLYYRFLDDIFFVWPSNREDLSDFENYLNALVPGIKITLNVKENITEFLDTRVYKRYGEEADTTTLQTCVYFKPTDTHQLLHPDSNHPKHTTRGVLKSQFIRFKRISSTKTDYDRACRILWSALAKRCYSRTLYRKLKTEIYSGKKRVHKTTPTEPTNDDIIPVINHFDRIGVTLTRHRKKVINKNPRLNNMRIIAAYRKHFNLKQLLVKNKGIEK